MLYYKSKEIKTMYVTNDSITTKFAEGGSLDQYINAAAVGRRLGISQSLMAQYINGTKKPSKERERMIMDEIANIASELHQICA